MDQLLSCDKLVYAFFPVNKRPLRPLSTGFPGTVPLCKKHTSIGLNSSAPDSAQLVNKDNLVLTDHSFPLEIPLSKTPISVSRPGMSVQQQTFCDRVVVATRTGSKAGTKIVQKE